ncbi:MAG: ATPase domain-containing protein [Actinomycetota bacterium]
MTEESRTQSGVAATGVAGLDDILRGGFPRDQLYLLDGNPGTGKTTLALKFLLTGASEGELGLYITLSESARELRNVAASHGWSLDDLSIFELLPSEELLRPDLQYTMFHAAEVELSLTTSAILAEVERLKPARVVLDSLSELRLLAQNSLRYRRQVLALKQFFAGQSCTVLFLDDRTADVGDRQVESIAHGVLSLEELLPLYGAERRRLRVVKLRGVKYRGGYHDFIIQRGGLAVFPRLVAVEHTRNPDRSVMESGIPQLDQLLGGGMKRGTSALLIGPAGAGKSSVAARYAAAAADRGENAAICSFEECARSIAERSRAFGVDIDGHLESGRLTIQQIDPAELCPGEFVHAIRHAVEERHTSLVVIDSLNGYLAAMPEERLLIQQLHELLTYLNRKGVLTLLVVAQHGMIGNMQTPVDTSYLADTIILFRFFEAAGEIRQAVSVLKQRQGAHERTIRELRLDEGAIRVGPPLTGFHGVLTGIPKLVGGRSLPGMPEEQ